MRLQEELVDYIMKTMQPDEIRFEPVYRSEELGFSPDDAAVYVDQYFKARSLAATKGIPLRFTGSRPGEVHGPYCNVYRNVINLLPDGRATACFAQTGEKSDICFVIGAYRDEKYSVDFEKISSLRQALSRRPNICRFCFNNYHCVGLCPDNCVLDHEQVGTADYSRSFRCRVQKLTAVKQILERAGTSAGNTVLARFIDI